MCHDVVGNVVCCAISFISMLYLTTSSCGSTHSLLPSRLCGGRQQANKTLVVACCDVHQKNALYVVCCVGVLEWHVFFCRDHEDEEKVSQPTITSHGSATVESNRSIFTK